jgi:hypothetical protein
MKLETDEVLKNIRILKVQTDLITGLKTTKKNKKILNKAYNNLLSSVNKYINNIQDNKNG